MIRDATELDIPRLSILATAYAKEAKKHGLFPYDEQTAIRNFALSMLSDRTCIKVSVYEGQVVGLLWATLSELPWSLAPICFDNILYVTPECRGTSAGFRLIREYEAWSKKMGAVSVSLSIASGITEERTLAFYEKLGYKLIGYQCRKEI